MVNLAQNIKTKSYSVMQIPKHEGIRQGKRCSEMQELVKASLEYIRHDRKQVKWNTKRRPPG